MTQTRYIQTVNGLIPENSLGIVLSHEHIIIDYKCAWSPPPENLAYLANIELASACKNSQILMDVKNNAHYCLDNLRLSDKDSAVEELKYFKESGGSAVIELSNIGLSPNPKLLKEISLETSLHIVAGCGYYRYIGQDDAILQMESSQLAEKIICSLTAGVDDTDIKAGIIGEVGTSFPLHPFEKESLIASAKAQLFTGAAINVHPECWEHGHLDVLDILDDAGADITKTVMSHMDELVEPDWHLMVAKRGCYISFDTFGSQFNCDGIMEPCDEDRINCLLSLLDKGYEDKVLLSHDTCYKIQLKKFGGPGYNHVISSIIPNLIRRGVSEAEIQKLLIDNPRNLLAR